MENVFNTLGVDDGYENEQVDSAETAIMRLREQALEASKHRVRTDDRAVLTGNQ